jgi:hypothetical protein
VMVALEGVLSVRIFPSIFLSTLTSYVLHRPSQVKSRTAGRGRRPMVATHRETEKERKLADGIGAEGGGHVAESNVCKKAWLSINHSIFSVAFMQEAMDLEGGKERFIFRLLDLVEAELKESGDRQDEWIHHCFFLFDFTKCHFKHKNYLGKERLKIDTLFSFSCSRNMLNSGLCLV